jgi:hypothetical protein
MTAAAVTDGRHAAVDFTTDWKVRRLGAVHLDDRLVLT